MKNSQDEIYNRRKRLIKILKETNDQSITSISRLLKVSELTIRRDVNVLKNMNEVSLKKGMVSVIQKKDEMDPFSEREQKINLAIAKLASKLVNSNSKVFINSSRLALLTASQMYQSPMTFLSNNVRLTNIPHHPKSVLLLSGGEIREPKEVLVGDYAVSFFRNIISDYSIIGVSGISPIKGLTTPIYPEAIINKVMIENTRKKVIIVGDFSRIGKVSNFKTTDMDKIDYLVTDQYANPAILKDMRRRNIEVIQAII
mgnify:CR=1 FL=1